jgi:hypothetical protein
MPAQAGFFVYEYMNKIFQKGSEWRKWDLHVHSPLSILNNGYLKLTDGSPDWEVYLQKLESLDFAALGITDYFTIEGYKKILEFRNQGRLPNVNSILPNIEFRLANTISARRDGTQQRRLNFHVIFSDEVSPTDIEEHFLHNIDFYYESDPQQRDRQRKLKVSNIQALGERLLSEQESFGQMGLCALEVGAMCTVVNHEQISDLLSGDNRFKNKYLLVLPEELSNLIDWNGQDHVVRKVLLQKSDAVFSANANTKEWCLAKSPYVDGNESFLKEFKSLKPCLHGSDAHKIEEIGAPCAKRGEKRHQCNGTNCEMRYCWIKADPTFEGLRQVMYEPEDRVFIGPNNPTPIKSSFTIEKIEFTQGSINSELKIVDTSIELNPALIAVPGGKGSGKTAFVDLIANCYEDRAASLDKNSFIKRIVNGNSPNLKVSLSLKNGSDFSKKVFEKLVITDGGIAYIAQGELESYIDVGSNLAEHIHNLIFSSPNVLNSVAKYDYLSASEDTSDIATQLKESCEYIDQIEKDTRQEVMEGVDAKKKSAESDLKAIAAKITEIEKGLNVKTIKDAKEKQELLAKHKTKLERLQILKTEIREAIKFVETQLPVINISIDRINKLLTELQIPELVTRFTFSDEGKLREKLELIDRVIKEEAVKVQEVQADINKFQTGVQDHAKLLDSKRELEVLVANLKSQENELLGKTKELKGAVAKREELLKRLLERVLLQRDQYDKVIAEFSSGTTGVLRDLKFEAEIRIDFHRLFRLAEDVLDNRKVDLDKESPDWILKRIYGLYESLARGDNSKIEDLVREVESLNTVLKPKIKQSSAVGVNDFYKFLYGNYLSVSPIVKYKNTGIDKLSLGQKATVLIKIYLAQGDKPIIIDSHDDHLDNEFIMLELVESLREAKKHRQIIIVSNNGNVVVNSDAEQIIIANRDDTGNISYLSGSLENPDIREKALKVLEGGYEAFNKRQQKYRINR